jgi:DNA polymerase I-like protein with 3'-5' exonuclease and polymerase domains
VLALQQIDDRVTVEREWFRDYKFHLLRDEGGKGIQALRRLVDVCIQRGLCSLDLETTGVDNRVYPDEFFDDGKKTRFGIRTVDRIVGICISFDGENGYYVPLTHEPEDSGNLPWDETWTEIIRLIEGARIIFHNKKFDAEFLYPVTGREQWKLSQFEDTFLMAKVISPLKSFPAGLKQLAKMFCNVDMVELDELFTPEKMEQLKRLKEGYNFSLLHPKEGKEYGCSDGIFTYQIYHKLREKIEGYEKIYDLEKSFCNVMRKMERNRVHVDVNRVNQLYVDCQSALQETGDTIRGVIEKKTGSTTKWMSLNIGSPAKLSECFFTDPEGLKLKPTPEMIATEGGGFAVEYEDGSGGDDDDDDDGGEKIVYSLKDEVLKSLHRAYGQRFLVEREGHNDKDGKPKKESIFELVLEYRHYDKMKGSYIEKLVKSHDKYGDVRPSFNQVGTDTSRLSCKAGKIEDGYSGVNFQGIPRDSDDDKPELFKQIRTVIIPRDGWMLVKLDYAGEELRVITNMSGDPLWRKSFLHEDGDVHSITARILFGKSDVSKDERNRGKRSNFAIIYGGGAGAISRNVGCSIEDGGRHMENMRTGLPHLMGYVDHQKKFAKKHKCVYTAFGRRMPIPTIDSPIKAIMRKAERCAINYTIQATSADVLKFAMCYVDKMIRKLGWEDRCRYVLTVHDEIVFEIRPQYLMEIVRKLDEWMVLPWMLPKAHGREWEVPLETEPGIDVHWRARFDYFAMVDGKIPDKKELNPDGTYKGKLKKGQFFENGRVYQEIPDFLKGYIWKLSPEESDAIKRAQREGEEWAQGTPPEPAERPAPASAKNEEQPILPMPPPERRVPHVEKSDTDSVPRTEDGVGVKGMTPGSPYCIVCKRPQFYTPGGLSCGEHGGADSMTSDGEVVSEAEARRMLGAPPVGSHHRAERTGDPTDIEFADTADLPDPPSPRREVRPVGEDEQVLRWTMTAVPSEDSQRKLQAVCILCEGSVPLRVVSKSGNVLVSEKEGLRVDPTRFQFLASLFGLGS